MRPRGFGYSSKNRWGYDTPKRAGESWSAKENASLLRTFMRGAPISYIAIKHQRTRGAITFRLAYLLGDDYMQFANTAKSPENTMQPQMPQSQAPYYTSESIAANLEAQAERLVAIAPAIARDIREGAGRIRALEAGSIRNQQEIARLNGSGIHLVNEEQRRKIERLELEAARKSANLAEYKRRVSELLDSFIQ